MDLVKVFKDYFTYKDGNLYWKKCSYRKGKIGDRAGFDALTCRRVSLFSKLYQEHRVIFAIVNGYLPDEVDHIDGNSFNNNASNLRAATRSQNSRNRLVPKNNTTGHIGVYKKKNGSYYVQVVANGKYKTVGTFEDFDLACLVSDEARDLFYGEYAGVNRGLRRTT